MRKFSYKLTICTLFILLFSGCASNKVTYQQDAVDDIRVESFRTYAWSKANEHNIATRKYLDNDDFYSAIAKQIDIHLKEKGFEKSEMPDFYVNYTITVKKQIDINTYNTYEGVDGAEKLNKRYGFDGVYGYFPEDSSVFVPQKVKSEKQFELSRHDEGSLVIDIISPQTGKLIWRGFAQGRLKKRHLSPEKLEKVIAEIIHKTLENFPAKK